MNDAEMDGWQAVRDALGEDLTLSEMPTIKHNKSGELSAQQPLTLENVEWALKTLGIRARYDMMQARDMLVLPEPAESMLRRLEGDNPGDWDARVLMVARLLREVWIEAAHGPLDHLLRVLAQQGRFHPAEQWLLGLADDPDGSYDPEEDYVGLLIDGLSLVHAHHKRIVEEGVRTWFRQAVSAVLNWRRPHGQPLVLVIVGPQGCGKTRWVLSLAPEDHPEFVVEGVTLDSTHKGDQVLQGASTWIAELGEMDGITRKADMEALKNFLTKREDVFRPAYGRVTIRRPRTTSYIGTANTADVLRDSTGSRRFLVVEVVEAALPEALGLDVRHIWRQALEEVQAGQSPFLNEETIREVVEHNARYEDVNVPTERLWSALAPLAPEVIEHMLEVRDPEHVAYMQVDDLANELGLGDKSAPIVRSQLRHALSKAGMRLYTDTTVGGERLRNVWCVPHPKYWSRPGMGVAAKPVPAEVTAGVRWRISRKHGHKPGDSTP